MALVNPADYKATLKVWSATGDGEIKKLDNAFLNDDVIIVEKAAPKTILNQIDITYEENGTDSGYYYFADKGLSFEADKEYDLILMVKPILAMPINMIYMAESRVVYLATLEMHSPK